MKQGGGGGMVLFNYSDGQVAERGGKEGRRRRGGVRAGQKMVLPSYCPTPKGSCEGKGNGRGWGGEEDRRGRTWCCSSTRRPGNKIRRGGAGGGAVWYHMM